MEFYYEMALSLFIIVPAIIGLGRFSKISKAYYPFIYCIWIGLVNEILSCSLMLNGHYNTVNSNIYMLLESILLTWQFKRWGLFQKKQWLLPLVMIVIAMAWILENFVFFSIHHFSSYFLITYSFIISLMSINNINKLIVSERKKLVRNPTFVLCVGFVIYYTFSVLSEVFYVYGLDGNPSIALKMHSIAVFTNFISIILYSFAILWMPSKQKFTLPSS